MKELAGSDTTASLIPRGTTQSIENIDIYTEMVHVSTTMGLMSGFAAPLVALTTGMVELMDFMQWSHLIIPGAGVLGTVLALGSATTLTAKSKLRKELTQNKEIQASNLSFGKMLSLKTKNTVLDLGKNTTGQEMKAIVRSSIRGLRVEYVSMPAPLKTWDETMSTLVEVHNLTTASQNKYGTQVVNK